MVHKSPPLEGHIEAPLSLLQEGGGGKYRAFVEDTGKAGPCPILDKIRKKNYEKLRNVLLWSDVKARLPALATEGFGVLGKKAKLIWSFDAPGQIRC